MTYLRKINTLIEGGRLKEVVLGRCFHIPWLCCGKFKVNGAWFAVINAGIKNPSLSFNKEGALGIMGRLGCCFLIGEVRKGKRHSLAFEPMGAQHGINGTLCSCFADASDFCPRGGLMRQNVFVNAVQLFTHGQVRVFAHFIGHPR